MLSAFLDSFRSQNLSLYSSPSHQSVRTLPSSIKLPDFFGAIPEAASNFRVNEFCRDAADETDAWLLALLNNSEQEDNGRRNTEERNKKTIEYVSEQLKPSLLAASLFPGAGRTQLRLCSKLLTCLLALEEARYEQSLAGRCANNPGREGDVDAVRILEPKQRARVCLQGLQNILSQLREDAKFLRVAEELESSIQSSESVARAQKVVGSYRPWFNIPIDILPYALDMSMDDSAVRQLTKAPLADMRAAAEDILYHTNIVYSIAGHFCHARRDQVAGASGSLTSQASVSLQRLWEDCEKDYGVSSQRCLQRIRDFVALQSKVMQSSSGAASGVGTVPEQYARALAHYVRGFLQWCFETEYYFVDEGERIRVTLKVPIDEDEEQPPQAEEDE